MARRDVDLVIRARDEARNALNAINQTLDKFVGTQKDVQDESQRTDSQLDRLGAAINELQKNLKGLTGGGAVAQELEKARSAMDRVQAATQAAAGEAIGYEREARQAARATAELRTESERLAASIKQQEASVSQARSAQRELARSTQAGATAQQQYAAAQEKLGREIAEQSLNLANYRNRFRELQIAITQVAQPTAGLSREFDRTYRNIERTQAKIADLSETQRLIATETDRATRAVERSRDIYGQQAASVGRAEAALAGLRDQQVKTNTALASSASQQNRLEAAAEKAAGALRSQDQALERAAENYKGVQIAANETEAAIFGLEEQVRGGLLRAFGQQRAQLKATEQAFAANSAEAQRLARELRSVDEPSKELAAAFEATRAAAARGRQEVRAQQEALQRLRGVLRESGGDLDEFSSRQNRFATIIDRASKGFAEYGQEARKAAAANDRLVQSQNLADSSARRLVGTTRDLARAKAGGARSTGIFSDAIREFYGETRSALSFTQRLRGEVLSLVAAYGGFFAVIDLVRNVVNSFQTLEAATNRLNVVFQGDDLAVTNELDFLRRNAERLGIEFGALAQEYTKFAIATQGTNLEGAETRRIFISVAEAARVNNLTLDQLQGTFVALTQIVSKGSVSMEELRQQLGDRLPGAIQIMAAGLNVGTDELIKMIEQGQVSSDALSSFADELDRRFADALPEALETTNAALGRFQNALFQTFLRIGEGGAIRGFTDLLRDLTETLDSAQFRDFADRVGAALGTLFDVLGSLAQNFDLVIIAATTFIGLKVAPFVVAILVALRQLPLTIATVRGSFVALQASMLATTGTLTGTAAAVTRLRGALTLLMSSTGIGLLVALIGTGIGLWITRTEDATVALRQHEQLLDQVRNAYDEAGGSVDAWRQRIENLTTTQARSNLRSLQVELRNLQQQFRDAIPRNILGGAVGAGGGFFTEVDALFEQFRTETIDADAFVSQLDELSERFRELFPVNAQFAETFDEIARQIAVASGRVEEADLILVALTGTEAEAREALRQLSGQIEETGDSARSGTEDLDQWREAIGKLREQVPSLADEIEDLDRRSELENAYQQTLRLARTWGQVLEAFRLYQTALNDFDVEDFISNLQGVAGGAAGMAAQVIRQFEGAGGPALESYFDVNAQRIGYGSDTITLSDGTIRAVTEGMRITRADADRDLVRRITEEFVPAVENAVGAERFAGLDPRQQAVLTSLAYNYGAGAFSDDLAGVAAAVREGSTEGVVQAIRDLGARGLAGTEYEEGARRRTAQEAALFESGGEIDFGGYVAAQEEATRLAEEEAEARARAAEATAETVDNQRFQIAQQELIAAGQEREAAVLEAQRQARQQNADITEDELRLIGEQAGRLFDLQNADRLRNAERERALAQEERVNELLQLRQQLQAELDAAQASGANEEALSGIQDQMAEVNRLLQEAIENALNFAIAMGSSDPQIQALISRLRELQFQGVESGNRIRLTYEQVEQALAGSLVNAANTFAQSLAEGKSVTESLRDAFLQFASDFLRQIAQMILQQLALNAAKGILGAFGFGAGQAIVLHSGGVVGARGTARSVDAGAFMNAMRYHSGGIAGLAPGEVPSILKRGEEVLTQDDPRHAFNGGGATGSPQSARIKIVNAIDGGQVVSEGLNTAAGEEAILNFIRANASSVRAAIES
jgi:tape measure domain-containing protein